MQRQLEWVVSRRHCNDANISRASPASSLVSAARSRSWRRVSGSRRSLAGVSQRRPRPPSSFLLPPLTHLHPFGAVGTPNCALARRPTHRVRRVASGRLPSLWISSWGPQSLGIA
jgi:hypothetical protein